MTLRSLAFLTLLLFTLTTTITTLPGCGGRKGQEIVLEHDGDGNLEHCYLLQPGDFVPSDTSFLVTRTIIKVKNGDWAEALKRVGLTEEQCTKLAH